MKCSVQNCNSDTKRTSKDHGLTFHLFPKQMDLRNAWIEALGLSEWQPRDKSTVCSEHFSDDDFYHTKCGMRKVKSGAVPIISQDACDDLDAPATMKACRICLATDTKLYSITDFKLNERYEQITGLNIGDDDRLPKMLCWECSQRLHSCHRFRSRALLSQRLMVASLDSDRFITLRDVKSIDRHSNGLQSTLTLKLNEANRSDVHIREPDANLKVEICFDDVINDVTHDASRELTHSVAHDVTDDVMDVDHAMDDVDALPEEGVDINCDVTPEDSRRQPKEEPVAFALADIKQESNVIFFNEFDQYDSDDDKKLGEVTKKDQDNAPKDKLRKKRPKLEKLKKVRKLDKLDKLAKREKLRNVDIIKQLDRQSRIKNKDVVSTTDRFKEANVKRRKTCDTIDETLFTISALTYDEQIDEINKRQETTAYKNAPYKCTICFRGFQIKDRHDAHIVRHSEQCGAFECFICKTRLKTGRALRKHLTAQHTEKFTCKGCPFETRNSKLTTYMGHIRIKHASDFVCELCGYTFVSKKGIDVHKKKKHRLHDKNITLEGPYCDMCEVRFISEEAHSRHLQLSSRHSSEDDPNRIRNDSQSMNCERSGRTVRRIERRPTVHLKGLAEREQAADNGPVSCEQCGIQLRDLRLYAQHFRRMHPDKNRTKYPAMKTPCMCEQCGRIFQSMALLKDHMWVHTGEKRFQCNSCEKSFTQKSNLVFHSRVHNAQRPSYDCPLCGKQFAFFNNRRRHMFIHTGLKPYRCDTCDKCFTTAGELRAHFQHVHLKKPWPKRARARRDWSKPQP